MLVSHNLKVEEIENYLNKIFSLQSQLIDKDFKIMMLEFELAMQKNLVESIKKIYQTPWTKCKLASGNKGE